MCAHWRCCATSDLTLYPDIDELLACILANARVVLPTKLVGMYLYGSLASGDFDPASSDIDCLVVVSQALSDGEVEALRRFHDELVALRGEGARHLEGGYVTAAWLRRDVPQDTSRFPYFNGDAPLGVYQMGRDWVINRYVLREYGATLYGPPPATLIDPISPEQLQDGVRDVLRYEWAKHVTAPEVHPWLHERQNQAFVVLTMCRALYVLDRGEFVSKPTAAAWAEQQIASEWISLIRWALATRYDPTKDDTMLPRMLDFMRYTLAQAGL